MLAEKPCKPEILLLLILTILVGIFVGIFVGWRLSSIVELAGDKGWLPATVDRKFLNSIVGMVSVYGVVLIGLVFFLHAYSISWGVAFGFSKPNTFAAMGWGLLAICMVLPVAFLLAKDATELLAIIAILAELKGYARLAGALVPEPQAAVKMLQVAMPIGQTIVFGFVTVLVAPFAEELIFRGIFYPTFKQSGFPRLALWGTSLIFAAIHLNLTAFIPLMFLALVLTLLYEKTENLIAPIVTHVMFNAVNFYLIVAPADWKPGWFVQ